MSAGVGKTYRMLQEAHALMRNGIDVKIGYIETHKRKETQELLEGLPIIPRRKLFYKGKELEELDVQAIINLHPEIVIVDELAHTNIEGSKNEKRWQDVMDILDAGINVISAVNIQHIESLQEEIKMITGIDVAERIPDSIVKAADEVVNIDLTSDELVTRLKEGKIYTADKIGNNGHPEFLSFPIRIKFCNCGNWHLREVGFAGGEKDRDGTAQRRPFQTGKLFVLYQQQSCNGVQGQSRKTARLASYYHSKWFLLLCTDLQGGWR